MIENIFMMATMIPMGYPLELAVNQRDYISAILILSASIASMAYHLVENQKHNMRGIIKGENSVKLNKVLLNVDRLCAILLIMNYFNMFIRSDIKVWIVGIYLLTCMITSETFFKYDRNLYIILHSIWHVGGAMLIYYLQFDYVTNPSIQLV